MNDNDKSARILKQGEQWTTERNIGYLEQLITKLLIIDKMITDTKDRQQANEIILKDIRRTVIADKTYKVNSFDDYLNVLNVIDDLLYVNDLDC